MLPAISDFLKTTFDNGLSKLVQASAVVPSAIFLLLNVLLIFPLLAASNSSLEALAPENLIAATKIDVWQVVVSTVLVLVMGYLLLNLTNSIFRFMTGESWADSVFGSIMIGLQKKRLERLTSEINKTAPPLLPPTTASSTPSTTASSAPGSTTPANDERTKMRNATLKLARATSFSNLAGYIAPTDLGNVINATASLIWERYQIDMTALMSAMAKIVADDAVLKTRLEDEKTNLDFLLNFSFVLGIFAIEYALLLLAVGPITFPHVWVPLAFLILAWCVYRAGVGKARTWGDVLQTAFDLHREELRKALHLKEFKNAEDERRVWKKVSTWLLWGDPTDDVFESKTETTPPVSVVSSLNIQVQISNAVVPLQTRGTSPQCVEWNSYSTYVIGINNTHCAGEDDDCSAANGVYFVVTDSQIPTIAKVPIPDNPKDWRNNMPSATLLPTGDKKAAYKVLWSVPQIPANGARVLQYRLPIKLLFRATVTIANPRLADCKITGKSSTFDEWKDGLYWIDIENIGTSALLECTIEVLDPVFKPILKKVARIKQDNGTSQAAIAEYGMPGGVTKWTITNIKVAPRDHLLVRFYPAE